MSDEAILSVTIPSTSTARDERNDTYTVYDIVITLGKQEWRTSIRYNTFRALHHAVKSKYNIRMPKLPGKKAFGNDQKTFIEKRRVGLQLYLQELLSYDQVRSGEEVASILNLGGRIIEAAPEEVEQTERGRALYDYVAEESETYPQISLKTGDLIIIIDRTDADGAGWWYGENVQGKRGYFPGNYVELLPQDKPLIGSMANATRKTSGGGGYPSTTATPSPHSTSPTHSPVATYSSLTAEPRRATVDHNPSPKGGYPTNSKGIPPPIVPPRGSSSTRGASPTVETRKETMITSPRMASKTMHEMDKEALNPSRLKKADPPLTLQRTPPPLTSSKTAPILTKGSSTKTPPPIVPRGISTASLPTAVKAVPGEKQDQRTLIATEILTTERTYVEQLKWLVGEYMARLNDLGNSGYSTLSKKVIKDIFSNVEIILSFHTELLGQIEQRMGEWNSETTLIGDIFGSWAPYLKMYKDYGNNFEIANETCNKLREHTTINNALEECKNRCQQLTLEALLIVPIQRLPRYNLLLQDLSRNTPETHPDSGNLTKALGLIKGISDELNESIRQSEQQRKFGDLAQGEGFKSLLEASRRLILEAKFPLVKGKGKKDTSWHLFLFNDKIVPAKVTRGTLNPVVIVPLNLAWINSDLKDKENIEIITPEGSYTFATSSEQERQTWLHKLRDGVQNNLADKSLPLEQRVGEYTYTINNHEGSTYSGYWLNGKRHGSGNMVYFSGNQYVGNWEHDNRSGKGCLTYKTGQLYDGEWKDDKPNGHGVMIYNDGGSAGGSKYEGSFVAGLREGQGVFQFCNGDKYEGSWLADRAEGQGKLTFQDGSYYEGQFEENKRHGTGTFIAVDGATYVGKWENGRRHGKGQFTDSKGNIYDGDWLDDRKHGVGTFTDATGFVYKGEWIKDCMEGKGALTSANGETYEGTWKENKKNGQGIWSSPEGYRYEGEWINGRKHGRGLIILPSGDRYEGPFVADKPHGTGLFVRHQDGAKMEGKWVGGVRDGRFAIAYQEDGKPASFSGMCKDNTLINSMEKHFELPPVAPDFNHFN